MSVEVVPSSPRPPCRFGARRRPSRRPQIATTPRSPRGPRAGPRWGLVADLSTWIKPTPPERAGQLGEPGEPARDDSALWLSRACRLLSGPAGTWGPLTYRGLVEDCFAPGVRSLVDAALEAPRAESLSCRGGEGDEPAAARFGGARWYEVLGCNEVEDRGAVAVVAARCCTSSSSSTSSSAGWSRTQRAEVAAAQALRYRRWFQRAFWLAAASRTSKSRLTRSARPSRCGLGC